MKDPKSVATACVNCEFWSPDRESQNKRTGEYEQGMCFLMPPTVHLTEQNDGELGAVYTRPVTAWGDFCGYWKCRVDA